MACNQTAVALLQELCMKRKWNVPHYEDTFSGGTSNEPVFEVTVTLHNGIQGVGKGRQKKAAKHEAAKKALHQLQERALPGPSVAPDVSPVKEHLNPHEELEGNPVGELQNLCMLKHLAAPVYTVVGDEGEPHAKVFTYQVTVSERSATGIARKKQLAKHFAAQNMLEILKNNLKAVLDEIPNEMPSVTSVPLSEEEKKKDREVLEKFKLLRETSDLPSLPLISPGTRFSDYHSVYSSQLQNFKEIAEKPDIKNEKDYLRKVDRIAEELGVKVSVIQIPAKSSGHLVVINMETDPPAIQAGFSEKNVVSATQQAACNILDFLKIMSEA